jgi:hypothetical protein
MPIGPVKQLGPWVYNLDRLHVEMVAFLHLKKSTFCEKPILSIYHKEAHRKRPLRKLAGLFYSLPVQAFGQYEALSSPRRVGNKFSRSTSVNNLLFTINRLP